MAPSCSTNGQTVQMHWVLPSLWKAANPGPYSEVQSGLRPMQIQQTPWWSIAGHSQYSSREIAFQHQLHHRSRSHLSVLCKINSQILLLHFKLQATVCPTTSYCLSQDRLLFAPRHQLRVVPWTTPSTARDVVHGREETLKFLVKIGFRFGLGLEEGNKPI